MTTASPRSRRDKPPTIADLANDLGYAHDDSQALIRHDVIVFLRIWQYDVDPERQSEFERVYSADGDWARLFGRSDGYRGTELFRRVGQPTRYLTVDRFESASEWHTFLSEHASDYAALDRATEGMTLDERELSAGDLGRLR